MDVCACLLLITDHTRSSRCCLDHGNQSSAQCHRDGSQCHFERECRELTLYVPGLESIPSTPAASEAFERPAPPLQSRLTNLPPGYSPLQQRNPVADSHTEKKDQRQPPRMLPSLLECKT